MSKEIQESKASIFVFASIVLVMLGALAYGLSAVKTDFVDGTMTEECEKLWLEQGEEVAVKNGC